MPIPAYRYTDDYLFEKMDADWQARRIKSRCVRISEPASREPDDASIALSIEIAGDRSRCGARMTRKGPARRLRGVRLAKRGCAIDTASDRIFFSDPR